MLLAGDIGGTKTVLALYNEKSEPTAPLDEQRYPSGRYDSLEQIVEEFLKGRAEQVHRASFGVTGPVVEGKASLPNLPWVIEKAQLKQRFDLETIAQAVPVLPPEDLETVKKGNAVLQGNMVLRNMATGGLYLGGGIPPRILPYLKQSAFTDRFINKGRLSRLPKNVPVRVILNAKAPLVGAACYGLRVAV